MNKEDLKYLKELRYSGFQKRLKNVSEKDSCFFIKLTPPYKELQKELSVFKTIKLKKFLFEQSQIINLAFEFVI